MERYKLRCAILTLLSLFTALTYQRVVDLDGYLDDNYLGDKLYNQTMLWGTYKPHLFFALKQRVPNPITLGLAWAVPDPINKNFTFRHTYDPNSPSNVTAFYDLHDGWSTAFETINDPLGNVKFEIQFLK